jgi:eukaryotic-like serine/threonine-protein kinase
MPPVSPLDTYPRRLGRYVLLQHLARGGMGDLHLALTGEGDFRRLCVVKQLLPHLVDDESVQRFVDEATVMVKLGHGNLVPVLESGCVDGSYFLAMDYVEGQNLRGIWRALLDQQRSFPLSLALHVVKEICRGLHYTHTFGDLGLVHRDVSPPNVLVSYAGEVKLADFGLAVSATRLQRTSPGILLGKLAYMAPEQARGERVDARADIFAAGVILWELVTNQRLFAPQATLAADLERAVNPTVESPSRVNPALPPALDLVARRALAVAREERYHDAEDLRRDLAMILAEIDPTTDAAALQRFLTELVGNEVATERARREQLLQTMTPRVKQLLEAPAPAAPAAVEGAAGAPLASGTILDGKYRIERLLGEGGMGRVYQAVHLGIGRDVALKVLMREFNEMADVVARFRREAWAANRIQHANIVEILDSGATEDGQLYYAMEYLAGTDLAEVLHREQTLKAERAIRVAVQICEGLAAAHEADVIHRDLKPENVFIVARPDAPEFVKIVDFGIAHMPGGKEITLPGLAMGTPEYMSPEQAENRDYDHRADIYSMGVVLYEMLTGSVPFRGTTYNEVLYRKISETVVPPRQRGAELSEELERLVMSALDNRPAGRPQTMRQMAYELRKMLEGRAAAVAQLLRLPESLTTSPRWPRDAPVGRGTEKGRGLTAELPPHRRRRRWPLVVAALVVVGGGSVALLRGRISTDGGSPRADAARPIAADSRPAVDAHAPGRRDVQVRDSVAGGPARVRPKKKKARQPFEGTLNPFRKRR